MAEKNRESNQALLKQKFISQNAFDNSESTLNVSMGTVKSAEAQVQIARNALRDAVATSPLAGIVAKRHVQPGEKVAFDSPLVTVVDLRQMELQAMVPSVDVPEIAIGMPVNLSVDGFGERRFSGRIERINPATETGTRSILVYVGIPNADGNLRGGMFATGRIALAAEAPVPTLPQTAIRTEAGQTFVWAIDNGRLVRRIVMVGRRDDEAARPLVARVGRASARQSGDSQGQSPRRCSLHRGSRGRARPGGTGAGPDRHRRPRSQADRARWLARIGKGTTGDGGKKPRVEPGAVEAEVHLAERVR
jgi:multidrug efflux pump subunit AcrA (membrane-fusion protein)